MSSPNLLLLLCLLISPAVQHERGPRTSTIRKQVALYFRGHKQDNGSTPHFSAALPTPAFFTAVTQLEPHNLELATVSTASERQNLVGLAQPTPKVCSFILLYYGKCNLVPTNSRQKNQGLQSGQRLKMFFN